MSEEELRLECLRLAKECVQRDPEQIIDAARRMNDFVVGKRDAEVIDAARSFAAKVTS